MTMENGLDNILQGVYALICQTSFNAIVNGFLSVSIRQALDTLVSLACASLALSIHVQISQLCRTVR